MIEKSPEAFRTISEVAEELDLPQHVLRFWETRFSQIKPMKRGGGRRYYRPEDVNLLKGIRFLLYGEGYTIKGVQRILKEQGVRHVASVWEAEEELHEEPDTAPRQPEDLSEPEPVAPEPVAPAPLAMETRVIAPQRPPAASQPAAPAQSPVPQAAVPQPSAPPSVPPQPVPQPQAAVQPAPQPVEPVPAAQTVQPQTAQPPPVQQQPVQAPPAQPAAPVVAAGLSAQDARQLKAALFELIECRQLLESTLARTSQAGQGGAA